MSGNKEAVSSVSNRIDDLLQQGFRISVVNKNTFYLYSTNKELLGSLMLYKDGKNKPEYDVMLDGLSGVKHFSQSDEFYEKLYLYVNKKYNFDTSFADIDKTPFTMDDMRKMWIQRKRSLERSAQNKGTLRS